MKKISESDVIDALESLGVTAMRVKRERDRLLAAAKEIMELVGNVKDDFEAGRALRQFHLANGLTHLQDAIDEAEKG